MKLAILGSAPSSLPLAPFKNEDYRAWVQGRVDKLMQAHAHIPGEFDIWGCSPGCWANIPRATRWFEVHRWQPEAPWFGPEYLQFLREFKGPVYTGGKVPEIPNHVVYPLDAMEEKFSSYFMTSSIALMMALAIDLIEAIREMRKLKTAMPDGWSANPLALRLAAENIDPTEFDKPDQDDVIGLWGVDMAAAEEYAYQRPGCHFFVLEAMRRGLGVYLPPESDLMRPMPVYGISEWDHNYIKLTMRAKELNASLAEQQRIHNESGIKLPGVQGELHALNHFVSTWTSPYGMLPGMVIRQSPGTGLGSGITHVDLRPVERMNVADAEREKVMAAMAGLEGDAKLAQELVGILTPHAGERGVLEGAAECLKRIIGERRDAYEEAIAYQGRALAAEKKLKKPRRR